MSNTVLAGMTGGSGFVGKAKWQLAGVMSSGLAVEWASVAALIAVYFTFSISLILYNKWLFTEQPKGHGFPFPVAVTSYHMLLNSCAAAISLRLLGMDIQSALTPGLWKYVLPVSLLTGFDIALSNTSFEYLDASFVEMLKPTSLVWILLLSFALGLKRPEVRLITTVCLMTFGQSLISANAVTFDWTGFTAVMLAAVMAAGRCVLIEVLLHGQKLARKLTSLETMVLIMPGAAGILAFATLIPYKRCSEFCHEGSAQFCIPEEAEKNNFCSEAELLVHGWGHVSASGVLLVVSIGAALAFALNFLELMLIGRTSALTLGVAGVLKIVLVTLISGRVFQERVTLWQVTGFLIALAGLLLYQYVQYQARMSDLQKLKDYELVGGHVSDPFELIDEADESDEEMAAGGDHNASTEGTYAGLRNGAAGDDLLEKRQLIKSSPKSEHVAID
eukprot:jgi/Chlat1/8922/Chrsp92S08218